MIMCSRMSSSRLFQLSPLEFLYATSPEKSVPPCSRSFHRAGQVRDLLLTLFESKVGPDGEALGFLFDAFQPQPLRRENVRQKFTRSLGSRGFQHAHNFAIRPLVVGEKTPEMLMHIHVEVPRLYYFKTERQRIAKGHRAQRRQFACVSPRRYDANERCDAAFLPDFRRSSPGSGRRS